MLSLKLPLCQVFQRSRVLESLVRLVLHGQQVVVVPMSLIRLSVVPDQLLRLLERLIHAAHLIGQFLGVLRSLGARDE